MAASILKQHSSMFKAGVDARIQSAYEIYEARFGFKPEYIAAAPGRVNLIGEHIDYNDGIVLPMAIERCTVVAGGANQDKSQCNIFSKQLDSKVEFELGGNLTPTPNCWSNYVKGVVAGFQDRNLQVPGFNLVVHSDIPVGAGLSSSAAMEVATATFLEGFIGVSLDLKEKALLCQKAEHDYAGVPCGIMDQFASTFGEENKLVKIDCRNRNVELLPIESNGVSFLVIDSHAEHKLADGEYKQRREECESALAKMGYKSYRDVSTESFEHSKERLSEVEYRRARHVISEIGRTVKAADALIKRDLSQLGELLYSSHASLRDDFEVSCPELDFLVETCQKIGVDGGVLGCRMTGGGFGGSTISLVKTSKLHDVIEQVQTNFEATFGIKPSMFSTRPARGAYLIKM